jgi:hypothetical protein
VKKVAFPFGALVIALGCAFATASLIEVPELPKPPPPKVVHPPALVTPVAAPLAADRVVPPGVEEDFDVKAAPWAPGVRLKRTIMDGSWEERRALIEDLTDGDVRSYAIGDLLPHGSLLVGISTTTADILVADREIVRLADDGSLSSFEDFAESKLVRGPQRVAAAPAFHEAADAAVEALRSEDPELVQQAIDALVDAGEPVADLLMSHVGSILPVPSLDYEVPTGSGHFVRPNVQGDLVISILERITGQTFGDPTAVEAGERRALVKRWERWWGQ